jgi:hypothetical protein
MWKTNSVVSSIFTGLCAGLMLATKETAVIHLFAIGAAGLIGWRFLPQSKFPPLKPLAISAVVFVVTIVVLFSWFGTNWSGLADLFRAVPHLAARTAGQGHEKPFNYYLQLMDVSLVLFPLTIAGIYSAICEAVNGTRKPHLPLVIYGLLIFLIYSAIPYKTPWLALGLWLPLALINGFGVEAIWSLIKNPGGRWVAALVCAGFLSVIGRETRTRVFEKPVDEKNPYAYAHTGEDLLRLPDRLQELASQYNLANPRIAVVAADAWPLPWYLRKFPQVGFWQPDQNTGPADFYITSTDVSDKLSLQLKDFRPEYFGVRPNVLIVLWTPPRTNALSESHPSQP